MTRRSRPLTAEERAAGSDDPEGQAETVLEDSERRASDRGASPGTFLEHRTSEQATPPVDEPVDEHPEAQTDG